MGIYLPNMEMPKKGEYHMTLYVCDDGYAYMDVDLFPVDRDRFEAVPVPPHGKLGDLDALQKQIDIARNYGMIGKTAHYKLQKLIKEATTIIPADPAMEGET